MRTTPSLINAYGIPLRSRFQLRAADDTAIARIILPPLTGVEAGHQGIGIELSERKVDHNMTNPVYVSDHQEVWMEAWMCSLRSLLKQGCWIVVR